MSDYILEFTEAWGEGCVQAALKAGVPSDLARRFDSNLRPVENGKFVLISHGDGTSPLMVATEEEFRTFVSRPVPERPNTYFVIASHPAHVHSIHDAKAEMGAAFTIEQGSIDGNLTITVWQRTANGWWGHKERVVLRIHMDGTVGFAAYYSDNSQKSAPVLGDNPLTEKILEECGVKLVLGWRPHSVETQLAADRKQFILAHPIL